MNFQTCSLVIEDDRIIEIGMMNGNDNRMILSTRTDINRRTGDYRQTLWDPTSGDRVTMQGQCTRGTAPLETPRQF